MLKYTQQAEPKSYLKDLGIPVIKVEDITGYPSILRGQSKNTTPKSFWRNFK